MLNFKYIFKLFAIGMLLFFSVNAIAQADMGLEKYSIQILNSKISAKPGRFVFNSITITNNSFQNMLLGVRFVLPPGWDFVTPPKASVEINRGEFVSLPFRILPSQAAIGDIDYPITVYFKNPISGHETYENFFVKIEQNVKWNASLLEPSILIEEKDSLSRFRLNVKNNGNKRELFEISIKSDLRLSLPSSGTQLLLWPGTDTTLHVYVASRSKTTSSKSVSFFVKSKSETVMITGVAYFSSDTYLGNKSKYGTLPIDFELFNINAFSKSTGYSFFDLATSLNLKKNRSISLRIRSEPFNAEYKTNSGFYTLDFKSKNFDLSTGSQNLFLNYQIIGYGVRANYKTDDKKEFEVFGVQSIISNAKIVGIRQENHKVEDREISTNILYVNDITKDFYSVFSLHKYQKRFSSSKFVSLSAGYSTEKYGFKERSETGYMAGYRYETRFGIAKLQSIYQYYSPQFPGILRGVQYGSHELRLGRQSNALSFYSETNIRNPVINDALINTLQQNFQSNEHGVRFDLANSVQRGSLGISYLDQYQQNNLYGKMIGYKSAISYSINNSKLMQSILLNYTISSIKGSNSNIFNKAFGVFYQLKIKDLGINANYTSGPNFYFDYLSSLAAGLKPQTHNVSVFYEFKNKSRSFYDRVNISKSNNSVFSPSSIFFRNEVYFEMPRMKSSVSIFSNINLNNPRLLPTLNISIKKTFDVPIFFKKKYHSASIFLFKDENNNNIFDKGEEALSGVNLLINGQTLKANKKGMIYMKNLDENEYIVDYRRIQNLRGWVAKDKTIDTLILNEDLAIGVPFKKSRMVAGKVTMELENSSRTLNNNLAGILIIATNKKGEMFRTTTNATGEFFINLKEDVYNVQIPTNIFGEDNHVDRPIITVDLTKENYSEIEFKVIQKRRKMNIKKG